MGDLSGTPDSVDLGSAKEAGLRLVASGKFADLSEACRAGLLRLEEDEALVDHLVALAEEGLASGVDKDFDPRAFIEEVRAQI